MYQWLGVHLALYRDSQKESSAVLEGTHFAHCYTKETNLVDAIQLEPVPGNLVINLVRLASDACDVGILLVDLLAHCSTKVVEVLGHAVECICS